MTQDTAIILAAIAFNILFADMIRSGLDRLTDHLRYRYTAYKNDSPYISPKQAEEALEKFLDQPVEVFQDILQAEEQDGGDHYRICPTCVTYKRNFMTQGRKRMCMDCYIGKPVE